MARRVSATSRVADPRRGPGRVRIERDRPRLPGVAAGDQQHRACGARGDDAEAGHDLEVGQLGANLADHLADRIRIPLADNLFAFSDDSLDGARLGLAIVTGVSSNFVVDPTDPRGFSDTTLVYDAAQPLHFGGIELSLPAGINANEKDLLVIIQDE